MRNVSVKERTISEIAKPFKMSLAAVSKHLKVLEGAHLIERRREGSFHRISLNAETLKSAEEWIRYYEKFWYQRPTALKNLLEKGKI